LSLRLIRELKPDVVFMDINIPGMDGIEVISEVHEKIPRSFLSFPRPTNGLTWPKGLFPWEYSRIW